MGQAGEQEETERPGDAEWAAERAAGAKQQRSGQGSDERRSSTVA